MLLQLIDAKGFEGTYDFVYLPMDFRNGAGGSGRALLPLERQAVRQYHRPSVVLADFLDRRSVPVWGGGAAPTQGIRADLW
eukprot:537790-Pyramimonas_sp.AAC.1